VTTNARIVVFDGFCHVCSGWVRFLARHPIDPPLELVPMQSDRGRALLAAHGIDPEDPMTFLVIDGDLVLTESDGALRVVTALDGAWRLAGIGRWVPKSWRDWLYRVLARNRYDWFGKRDACYLPEPIQRSTE
jgi:predicted DCC family thiol-disulfide oxidoreductase YuxK